MSDRKPVTEWLSWRDIFVSETPYNLLDPSRVAQKPVHVWPKPDRTPGTRYTDGGDPSMKLSAFVRVDVNGLNTTPTDRCGLDRDVYIAVVPTQQAIEAVRKNTIHIDYDTMGFEVILWKNQRALVACMHGLIIGSVWLAKIDTRTIPSYIASWRGR